MEGWHDPNSAFGHLLPAHPSSWWPPSFLDCKFCAYDNVAPKYVSRSVHLFSSGLLASLTSPLGHLMSISDLNVSNSASEVAPVCLSHLSEGLPALHLWSLATDLQSPTPLLLPLPIRAVTDPLVLLLKYSLSRIWPYLYIPLLRPGARPCHLLPHRLPHPNQDPNYSQHSS